MSASSGSGSVSLTEFKLTPQWYFSRTLLEMPREVQAYIYGSVTHLYTGSRVFGYATEDSDFDVVVLRPEATKHDQLPFESELTRAPEYGGDYAQPLNFKVRSKRGQMMNVIVVNTNEAFDEWRHSCRVVMALKRAGHKIDRELSKLVHKAVRGDE